jgi:hypothetical protein
LKIRSYIKQRHEIVDPEQVIQKDSVQHESLQKINGSGFLDARHFDPFFSIIFSHPLS